MNDALRGSEAAFLASIEKDLTANGIIQSDELLFHIWFGLRQVIYGLDAEDVNNRLRETFPWYDVLLNYPELYQVLRDMSTAEAISDFLEDLDRWVRVANEYLLEWMAGIKLSPVRLWVFAPCCNGYFVISMQADGSLPQVSPPLVPIVRSSG